MNDRDIVHSKRNNSIELLRCLLMSLIVLHHICLFSRYGDSITVRACSAATAFSTDAFAFITGYYGTRLKWRKVFRFLGIGLFSSIILWILGYIFLGEKVDYRFSLGWFGNSYLALLLVIPFVNAAVRELSQDVQTFAVAFGCYCVAMVISWLPIMPAFCLFPAGWHGHSFNTILFLYVMGRFISNMKVDRVKNSYLIGLFLGGMLLHLLIVGVVGLFCPPEWADVLNQLRDFNAPWLLIASVAVVVLFSKIRLPHFVDRYAGQLAPSMFSVYLLHEGTNPSISRALYRNFNFSSGLIGCVEVAGLVFATCLLIDLTRRIAMFGIKRLVLRGGRK